MREISCGEISEAVSKGFIDANYFLGEDVEAALKSAYEEEISSAGRSVLSAILKNAEIARSERMAMCQDTGMAVVFVELGQEVHIVEGSLVDAINEGVRIGYKKGYLRCSVVADPLLRENTGDNTPAVIHISLTKGEALRLHLMPKGFGSENAGGVAMLAPADDMDGIKRFVLDTVRLAGSNPCPPVIVGLGIGGTMELAAYLAKKALLRPIGEPSEALHLRKLEEELLHEINKLGIGPGGLGGKFTALAVNALSYPTHIAGLPVAVNLGCHAMRHVTIEL